MGGKPRGARCELRVEPEEGRFPPRDGIVAEPCARAELPLEVAVIDNDGAALVAALRS